HLHGHNGHDLLLPPSLRVMPGLVPGIHASLAGCKHVDGRREAGHDDYGSSCNIFSIRSRMPPHWLAPTVTGARLPSPRPQIALSPRRLAASRSTPPGGAA